MLEIKKPVNLDAERWILVTLSGIVSYPIACT